MKSETKANLEFGKKVGLAELRVLAINPDKAKLNKILGKDDSDDDKEIEYVSEKDGVDRIRLSFVLENVKTKGTEFHNILMAKANKVNQDATKIQIVNQTGDCSWVPFVEGGDEPDYSLLPEWFTQFQNKAKEVIGKKTYRVAYQGEEDLMIFMRTWLGKANMYPQKAEACTDTILLEDADKLFTGNVKELTALLGTAFETTFVGLFGVRTDKDDKTKQYQQIWTKGFLPGNFMKFINNGMNFPNDWSKKQWEKFQKNAEGEYGFTAFHKLEPLQDYNPAEDLSQADEPVDNNAATY